MMATERESRIGDNKSLTDTETKKFKGYVSEIERLAQEMRDLSSERAGVYKRAKEEGFDNKAIKEVIRLRRLDNESREHLLDTVDNYMHALGMLADTPLGQAAMHRDGVTA
jgi:uncharacterized protein (UPF0335 family)